MSMVKANIKIRRKYKEDYVKYGFTYLQKDFYRCDCVVVRVPPSQSVDLGFISQVELNKKLLKNGIHSLSAWRLAK